VVLVAAPALAARLLMRRCLPARARLRSCLFFSVSLAALLLPWAVRNDRELGRSVVGSTLAGYNLFRHNSALPSKNYLRHVPGEEGESAVKAALARRQDLRGGETAALILAQMAVVGQLCYAVPVMPLVIVLAVAGGLGPARSSPGSATAGQQD